MEATPQSGAVASARGSLYAHAGSKSGSLNVSCANFCRNSMGINGSSAANCEIVKGQTAAPTPKWKRQVKLPSHLHLF